jgi:signal transduction histidine kinase
MVTVYENLEYVRRAFRLGATDYLSKATGPQELLERVQAAIGKGQSKPHPPPEAPALTQSVKVADDVLVDTAAAFIHKLNNEFVALASIARRLAVMKGSAYETDGVAAANALADLTATIDSAQYILQRFRNTMGRHPGVMKLTDIHRILKDVHMHFPDTATGRVVLKLTRARCMVLGDYELLWHLFENLIRNGLEALHGRDEDVVTVATSVDSSRHEVRVVIRDTGDGIAPEVLPRIFDLNYTTKPKGLGVGLYLVRRAAHIHRGQVKCESKLGKGTTFMVSLPLKTPGKNEQP